MSKVTASHPSRPRSLSAQRAQRSIPRAPRPSPAAPRWVTLGPGGHTHAIGSGQGRGSQPRLRASNRPNVEGGGQAGGPGPIPRPNNVGVCRSITDAPGGGGSRFRAPPRRKGRPTVQQRYARRRRPVQQGAAVPAAGGGAPPAAAAAVLVVLDRWRAVHVQGGHQGQRHKARRAGRSLAAAAAGSQPPAAALLAFFRLPSPTCR